MLQRCVSVLAVIIVTLCFRIVNSEEERIDFNAYSSYHKNALLLYQDFRNRTGFFGRFDYDFDDDYVCNLSLQGKHDLCKKIFPALLNEILQGGATCEYSAQLLQINVGINCLEKEIRVESRALDENMIHCFITFKISNLEKFLSFYVSRTYKFRGLFSSWSSKRNVFVYQPIDDVNRIKTSEQPKNAFHQLPYFSTKPGDEGRKIEIKKLMQQNEKVEVVGITNDFSFKKLKKAT